jgi:hypothetical protein
MLYSFLADVLDAVHVGYVGYVVVGELLILLGLALRWSWVRNPWFRWTHLIAITIVGMEAILGIKCPLTVWVEDLTEISGGEASGRSFIGRLLHGILIYDVPEDHWMFPAMHIGFAVLVIATFVLAPPRRFGDCSAALRSKRGE